MNRRIIAVILVVFSLGAIVTGILLAVNSSGSGPFGRLKTGTGTVPTQFTAGSTAPVKKGCSVTGGGTGYSFSWLHVSHGYIVDSNNCVVYLSGFNTAGTEFSDAVGGMSVQRIALFSKTFRMNLWRLNINVTWWNENDYVPKIQMSYRDWIAQLITWMKANGNYVEITRTNQYPPGAYPPCGKDLSHNPPVSITLCPSQNQGKGTNTWQNNAHFLDETLTFWKTITPLYKNDPAIVYNIWNEMPRVTDSVLWRSYEETLISTVRAIAPDSLIFLGGPVYNNGIGPLEKGTVPDFTEPNLVYDFHVYPQSAWYTNWPQRPVADTQFAQSRNHGIDIGEFGTSSNYTPYLDSVIKFAIQYAAAITLYQQGNVMTKQGQLTAEGQIVQRDYAGYPQ